MKTPLIILAAALALTVVGCGGDDSTATEGTAAEGAATTTAKPEPRFVFSDGNDPRFATISKGDGPLPGPEIDPPDLPAPKVVLVRELGSGSGAAAELGDVVALRYLGTRYESGKAWFQGWLPSPVPHQLGVGQWASHVWEEALVGMREGGRRELILPAQFASGDEAVDYVIEMVRVEPAAKPPPGG